MSRMTFIIFTTTNKIRIIFLPSYYLSRCQYKDTHTVFVILSEHMRHSPQHLQKQQRAPAELRALMRTFHVGGLA